MTMGGFSVALGTELALVLRSRRVQFVALVPAMAAALRVLLEKLRFSGEQARSALGGRAAVAADLNAHGPFVDGLSAGLALAFLALVAISAYSIAADRDHGVVRHLLVRRVSRSALVVARFLFLVLLGLVVALAVVLAAWAAAALLFDFIAVVEDGYEIIGTGEMRHEILLGLALALTPLPAIVAFGLLVSVAARSAVEAVSLALGASLAFDLFKGFLGDAALLVYATYPPSLVDQSYLKDVARIVRGYSDVFVEEGVLRLNLLTPLPAAVAFLTLALVIAHRRRM